MSSRSGELLDQGLDFFTCILARLSEDDWERRRRVPAGRLVICSVISRPR
jgi:hypothetical protein